MSERVHGGPGGATFQNLSISGAGLVPDIMDGIHLGEGEGGGQGWGTQAAQTRWEPPSGLGVEISYERLLVWEV